MEPVVEKFLQGIPFAGMGTALERNGLIGVVRNLIKSNKYTVDYILNYCESVGYQRNMAEEVFEELTGISPKLIINNNEYYDAPIYVPACTIAWGLAKTKPNVAFYVVPGSYGYSVMEKNETDAPVEVTQTATIPEAIDELKKVAKNIQTLDKIITSKLLETEDVQSSANDIDQTAKPYFSDPIRELKKNFKNKVIDINTFEREARKLVAEQKISVEDGEHLMDWEQDLLDNSENPEEYNKILQKDEEWNQLQGTETEGDFEDAYHQLFNMLEELDILSQFAADTGRNEKEAYIELAKDIGQEFGVDYKSLLGEMELRNPEVVKKIEELSLKSNEKEIKTWINSSKKVKSWTSDEEDEYLNSDEYLDSYEYLYSQLVNGNITEYKNGVKKLFQEGPSKLMEYIDWLEEHNINPKEALKVMKNASLKKVESNFTSEQEEKFKHLWELNEQGNISEYETELKNMEGSDIVKFINWMGFYGKGASLKKATNIPTGNVPTEKITLEDGKTFTVRYNPKEKGITTIFNEDGKEIGVDAATRLQLLRKLFHKGEPTIVNEDPKSASKKVTAENITLEDMEEEDNKSESEKEVEKINETPIDELLEDNTPLDFFEKETQDDKVDTINDVVSKCITEFSDKFKDFDKYDIKMLSYKTKILDPYTPTQDEMIPDNEVNADAVLQVILSVNNKADESAVKKLLVVFSITDGKMHWTGTVRDESNNIVAFTEEGLDSIFNEPEEITEDII